MIMRVRAGREVRSNGECGKISSRRAIDTGTALTRSADLLYHIMGIRRLRFCCPKGCWKALGHQGFIVASPNRSSWAVDQSYTTIQLQTHNRHISHPSQCITRVLFVHNLLHGGRKGDCIFHVNGWRRHDPCQCLAAKG